MHPITRSCSPVALTSALVAFAALTPALHAATIGHWRFEQNAQLADSGPNNIGLFQFNHPSTGAQNALPAHYALPTSGTAAGAFFPKNVNGSVNAYAIQGAGTTASFNHRQLGADISAHDANLTASFSFEAFVNLSYTNPGSISVLAGQGVNSSTSGSWALAVTGEHATLGTRNIIFQIDPSAGWGGTGFQTLDSNLALNLNTDYYIAVTANFSDTTASGITIYLKNLSDPQAVLQVANLTHSGTIAATDEALSIGAAANGGTPWYGTIDEVRLSDAKLTTDQLLISSIPEPSSYALLAGGALGFFAMTSRRRR